MKKSNFILFAAVILFSAASALLMDTNVYALAPGGGTVGYIRSDDDCSDPYEGCEKTYCRIEGTEQCSAQYCNKKYCG